MDKKKIILASTILIIIFSFFAFDLQNHLNFENLKNSQQNINSYYLENSTLTIFLFFIIYVLAISFSLPGAAILTILAGAIFGLLIGVVIVSFASTIGATISFLSSRYILRNYVEKKFPKILEKVNKGIEKEGNLYLFSLRLIPLFPFFVINLVMGLTKIKTSTFYLVTQIGALAGTIVYVNAGSQLSQIESLSEILSPGLIFAFVLLGIFPFVVKYIMKFFKKKK